MAKNNAPNRVEERTAPSTTYTVEGSPEDYRYVLRGADLVLIDKNNQEHIFLFVGNIMSLNGRVDMTFSNGAKLNSGDLFERSEMVDVQSFNEEEISWDARDESDPEEQSEGNTNNPDGADSPAAPVEVQNVQAKPTQDLKQQLMQALKDNDNTSKKIDDSSRNENVAAEQNTNTSDKQGGAVEKPTPPEAPTLAPPHITLTDATNSGSKLDTITNITVPHFEGTAEPGSELTLYVDDVAVATGEASVEGKFLFILDNSYADGMYSVYLTSEKYGDTAQTSVLPLEIDTTPPALPSIELAAEYDTGESNTDNLTNDSRLGLEGSYASGDASEAGTTLTIQARAQGTDAFLDIGTATVQEDGTWSFRLPAGSGLADGTYDFQLMAEDVAGNKTAPGAAVLNGVKIDTVAPLLATELELDQDSSNPNMAGTDSDFITSDNQFELSGSASDDAIVRVYIGNVLIGETTSPGGAWNFAPGDFNFGSLSVVGNSAVLADGNYDLTVVAFDEAGNESAKAERALVIDTTIAEPEISIAGMVDAVDGIYYIGENNPEFTVSGEALSSGTFSLVSEETGLPVAANIEVLWNAETNSYTFASPDTLSSGIYEATFTNMDAAGNEKATSLRFQVESERPPNPLLSVNDTGSEQTSGDPITNNPGLTISFAAGARLDNIKEVRVFLDGNNPPDLDNDTYYLAEKQGDSWVLSPEFNLDLRTALTSGYSGTTTEFSYTVAVVDRAGRTDKEPGESFESTSFVYDTQAPVIADLDLVTDDNNPNFDGIPDDYRVDLNDPALTADDRAVVDTVGDPIYVVPVNPTFGGTCEIGSDITIILGNDVGTGPVQTLRPATGSWEIRFGDSAQSETFALTKGEMNKVTIRSTDQAGNTSEEVVFIKVAGAPPAAPSVDLADDYNTGSNNDDVTRGVDDGTPADKADRDGLVQLNGNAPGASYVIISYVDENGDTQVVQTSAGSDRIPVLDSMWESPAVLLTDTSTTTHQGTDYTFSVVAYDAANQPSPTTTYTATIDRSSTTPTIDLESDSAGSFSSSTIDYGPGLTGTTDDRTSLLQENNVLTFSGVNAEDGATVWLLHKYNGGSFQELAFDEFKDVVLENGAETGSWSIDLDTTDPRLLNIREEGEHTFIVRSMDKAGNIVDSAPLTVNIDSIGPGVSSEGLDPAENSSLDERFITANPDLDALDDAYAADTITRNPDFTLTGTLTAEPTDEADNVVVRVFKDNFQIGVADVSSDGTWSYDFSSGLAAGLREDYTFYVKVTDRAGNTTTGNDITITVDRTPPSIFNFELRDADDSYYDADNPVNDLGHATDNYTNASSLTLVGSSDVAAPVLLEYSLDGGTTYTSLFAIPNGASSDNGTNWTQNGLGDWTYTINVDDLQAALGTTATEHVLFRATASDSAGNEIAESFTVSVDRLAPSGTTIDLNAGSDSVDVIGNSMGEASIGADDDNRTNDNSLLLTGSAEAGTRVEIYRVNPGADYSEADRGTLLGVVTADSGTGAWNFTHNFDIDPTGGVDADGKYDFVAVAVDSAGNRSSTAIQTVHRDTEVDTNPTLAINDQSNTNAANPSGAGNTAGNPLTTAGTYRVDGDGNTYLDKSFITLEGELQGYNSTVDPVAAYVYENGTLLGRATITGSKWRFDVTSLEDARSYAFTLKVEDSAGNTAETAPLHVTIDSSTHAPTLDLIDADDTSGSYFYSGTGDALAGGSDEVTNPDETGSNQADSANAFTLEGNVTEVGSTITLYVARSQGDGTFSAYEEVTGVVTQPSGGGTGWSCTVPDADLAGDGKYRFKAVAKDLSGNTAEQHLDIKVDGQAPSLLNDYELWLDNDSGAQDLKTNGSTLELHGRLSDTSDQDIVLYIRQGGGAAIKVTNIDWATGEWSFDYSFEDHGTAGPVLPEGDYSFVLYAEDRAGNLTTYPASGSFDVEIDRTLSQPSITLSDDSNTYGGPALVDTDGNGEPDGASDDYTGLVPANGTNIFLDINADSDSTVAIYVMDPSRPDGVPIVIANLGTPGSGFDLCQDGIQYNTSANKWDTFTFDGAGYQNDTNEVTLLVVANDGGQTAHSTYTFTIDDEAPDVVAGNAMTWEPADNTASHITNGTEVENATNDTSIILSGAVSGDGQDDITVEIFGSTKSSLSGVFGARVSLGMATVNNAGEWTFEAGSDTSPLAEAFHKFTARIVDKAGNFTEVTLDEVLVDRTTPQAPGLSMVGTEDTDYTDGLTETGGDGYYLDGMGTPTIADDIYYNDNSRPQFRFGGLEDLPGSFLTIIVDGGAPEVINFSGANYAYTPSTLDDGSHSIRAYVTDAAGNQSATTTMNFVVDTVNPVIPPDQVELAADSNTGSANDASDPVTKAENPEITGVSDPLAAISVEVRDDKGTSDTGDDTVYVATTVAGADGSWSVNVPAGVGTAIASGTYDVSVTAIDKAGNTTVLNDVISFEVNRDVEITTGTFRMVENDSNDTGFSPNDQYTGATGPSFSWEATEEVTARFVFYKNGIPSPILTVVPEPFEFTTTGGVTTWTPAGLELADGDYTVKAVFIDTEAGNETDPDDNTVDFTVDTTPTTLTAELATDSGISDDWVTNPTNVGDGSTVTFEGNAPSGTTPATDVRIQIYSKNPDGSRTLLSPENVATEYVEVLDNGNWTYTVNSGAFPVGDNDLVIVATDLAGNTTEIEQALNIDTEVSAGTVVLAEESNSGTYEEDNDFIDNKTNDATPRLTGTAEPNATIDLYLGDPDSGGTLIGSNIPTDADGNWSFNVVTALTDDSVDLNGTAHTFVARVTDRAGNQADATGTIIIDTQAPDESAAYGRILPTPITVGSQTVYSDTGLDHTDGYTSQTRPTLIGEVPEGHSRVDVYVTYPDDANPTLIGTTKADVNGAWELDFPDDAAALTGSTLGTDYQISVKSWDDAGNVSADFSPARTITIDTSVGDADGDLDDDLDGLQPARIRFGAAFDAANAPGAVSYDESDNTLKTNLTNPVFDITLEPDCDTVTLTLIKLDRLGNPVSSPVENEDVFVIKLGPDQAENPPADGNWAGVVFKGNDGLPATINGNWLLQVSGTDRAGNAFSLEDGQSLVVNGIPPEFTMSIVEDQAGQEGHGLYAGDSIVNAAAVHFAGEFGADVDWQEISNVSIINSVDNSVFGTLTAADITGPTWTMDAQSIVDGGASSFSFYVRAQDNFGNEFWYPSASEPLTYIVDRNPPTLNEDSVDLVSGDDTEGIFRATDTDNATTERTPDIEFTSEENSKIELLLDGALVFTAMPPDPNDDSGTYTYALGNGALGNALPAGVTYNEATKTYTYTSASLADGEHTFTLRSTDLAGNVSNRDLLITVDNAYADADLTADLASTSDGGIFGDNVASHDDNLTNEASPELSGSAEAGSAVRIYLQRFDTKAQADADTDFVVGDADWDYHATHHEIVLNDNETSWSWDAVQADGSELADGYYKVIVVSEDRAGNQPEPEVFVFGKDTDSPSETDDTIPLTFHLQDHLEGADLTNEGSATDGEVQRGDLLDSSGNNLWVTSNWMPTIGGRAESGSQLKIVLRIDGDLDGDLDDPTAIYKELTIDVTDPSGAWAFDFAGEETGAGRLADGIYTATVTCTDPAGNSTTMSPSPQFQVSSVPPGPPTIRLDQDDDSYDSQTSNDGITNRNTNLTLKGTAEAGATVRLYRSVTRANTNELIDEAYLTANLIVTLTANASGEWSYEIPTDFEDGDLDPNTVDDGSYRYFVAGDYFNGNTYYSLQATNSEGQALINADGSPILKEPTPILDGDDQPTGEYNYPDYVLEVDTELADPTFELGLILDTTSGGTEEERRSNSSRMDSGIDNEWRTPEEIAANLYLGEPGDFWLNPGDLTPGSTYGDWRVKTSGPTIEGNVEAGSIVYVERFMSADFTDNGVDDPVDQWVTVGIVDQEATSEGTWRFVFPAEYENAEYQVRIRVVDKAGNDFTSETKTIIIDAEIKDTVLDLPDAQDTELHWTGVAAGTVWADIADTASIVGLDYVQKGHLPTEFESGNKDDLTTENNLLLSGEVEVGSRMYLTDTRQGVTVRITPVLVLDPAEMLGDDSATEAYYVKVNNTGDVGVWEWKSVAQFTADHGADYDGIYFHISNDGTWQYRTGELDDVKHAYTIENIDLAGNRAVTTPLAVEIDHEFSNAAIALSMSSDTGPFGDNDPAYDDRITSDGTPSLRLYGDSGATYLVYAYRVNEDGTVGGNVNANGTPMVTGVYGEASDTYVTIPLADGGYQLRLVNISESGHVSEAIYPPPASDGTYVADDRWDEGASQHPLVIDTLDPVIPDQATLEAIPGYHVHVEDQDLSDPNNEWTQQVTVGGRPLPIIVSGDAADVDGNGIISDLITTDSSPTIQVFVEAGTMIAVSGMGYASYLTDTDNDGIITLDPANHRNSGNPYANGSYDLTIRFGDIAGNVSDPNPMNFSIVIDAEPPSASVSLATDSGTSSSDNLTNDTTPTLTGLVSADAVRYTLTIGGTTIERHIGDGGTYGTLKTIDGVDYYEWSYTPTLGNGEYAVSITAWDRAGNAFTDSLSAYHPDDPNTITDNVPLIVHETGELPIYAGCESNRSGSRIYLDIDYSVSDAYNDASNNYAGSNQLVFTYHYKVGPSETEIVEMALGESDYSNSLRWDANLSSIDFKLVDSAGNESATGTVDIASGTDGDGVYSVTGVTGNLSSIPETVGVDFELGGQLQDENGDDTLEVSDVETIRATITGDVDGDGTTESITQDVIVAADNSWSLSFTQELAAGDYDLDLSALSADGDEITLASSIDLNYDFTVLTEQMATNQSSSTQVLFDGAENSEPAAAGAPSPGDVNTVTVDVDPVVVEEHVL